MTALEDDYATVWRALDVHDDETPFDAAVRVLYTRTGALDVARELLGQNDPDTQLEGVRRAATLARTLHVVRERIGITDEHAAAVVGADVER